MCFSPEASFGLSAVLAGAGIYCVQSAIVKNRPLLCLAIFPLIFSFQQSTEGLVWTALIHGDAQQTRVFSLVFLAFALVFWPFWIPFCTFILEPPGKRSWLIGALAFLALTGGLILYLPAMLIPDVLVTEPTNHSIHYDLERSPVFEWIPQFWCDLLYAAAVTIPALLCRQPRFFLFGVGLMLSAVISRVFYWYASASVWCFFAATLSLYLCVLFRGMPSKRPESRMPGRISV